MGVETKIELDKLARYRSIMGGIEIDDRHKDEMIEIVISVMQTFVDNAFGVGSSQLALEKKHLTSSFRTAVSGIVQTENNGVGSQRDDAAGQAKPGP